MKIIEGAVRQPVTVTVGVILVLLSGLLSFQRIPIQLTPTVEDTIIAVSTRWEGASPAEIEQEVVDKQEEKLQGIANLRSITSQSRQGVGSIRLEFAVGTPKESALREVSDKLREVPDYPENVDEPVVEASDPGSRDYIAWILFKTTDPAVDIRTFQDFAEDIVKPVLERVPGISQINVLGGREREVQVRYDPERLASRGIGPSRFMAALRQTNRNVSAGALTQGKSDVRVRLISQYDSVADIEETVVAETDSGPVYVRDVATVVETFKEAVSFVRAEGEPGLAINAQKEVGANVMAVMAGLDEALDDLNRPGGVLDRQARQLGLGGTLTLEKVYDQTGYIEDALSLVRNNIWIGGSLAVAILLLFLGSVRSAGIITVAIPISVIGAVVMMVALGRSINVISLAGMAFAVGMVVDNAIVVLENIYRHLEMGKKAVRAALDGANEVFGAVLAATLTTVVVFIPILLIEDEAGQLFRDIALAIVAAVGLSLVVSLTVIPTSVPFILHRLGGKKKRGAVGRAFAVVPDVIAGAIYRLAGSFIASAAVVLLLTALSLAGTWLLMPPTDYLPQGNRNLVLGIMIPPPGYSLEQQLSLGRRIEEFIRPAFAAGNLGPGTEEYRRAAAAIPPVPLFGKGPGAEVVPPPLSNYFLVGFGETMFHGGVATEPRRVVDLVSLFSYATRPEIAPGVLSFAFQVPLFQLGGRTGSAVKINLSGDDLAKVSRAALAVYLDLIGRYSVYTVQPDPSNFNLPEPELQILPRLRRLAEVGLTTQDLGVAVQSLGDGAFVGEYRRGGQTVDLKLLTDGALAAGALTDLGSRPIATPLGGVVPLSSLAELRRENGPPQINRVERLRAVTLQFTPPAGLPLEQAMNDIDGILSAKREGGAIPPDVETSFTGTASKLDSVQKALLGDGTLRGTLTSSFVLALLVVYLLMCVLFQSFIQPLVIMFSVPLATLGGFGALALVHKWSLGDPYLPVQNLDVLTMLGFVILIGVVVNNAILLVHQARNFMTGADHGGSSDPLPPREAIREAVRSRVRPIFMSTLTSVGGMLPLVLMPGSGSELYRGLGSVVVGGLIVSTLFTLFLVPLLMNVVFAIQGRLGLLPGGGGPSRLPATASLVLLLPLLGLPGGCATGHHRPQQDLDRMVEELTNRRLEALEAAGASAAGAALAPSPVDEMLRERRDELELLGGPASHEKAAAALGSDLLDRPQGTVGLALEDAVAAATEHNLGLRLARLGPAIDREGVTVAEAVFDTVLFGGGDLAATKRPQPVPILNGTPLGVDRSESNRQGVEAGLRRRLSSGASLAASTRLERFENDTPGIDFDPDPAGRALLGLEARQPLLKGYGQEVNEAEIMLGRNRYRRSLHDAKAELLVLIALTEQAYWDLHEAWSRLRILQRLTEQGAEVERVLRQRLEFDTTPAQYSDALATVEQRRANVVRARRTVKKASDRLKALMNDPELTLSSELLIEPAGAGEARDALSLRDALVRALAERPEVRATLVEIEDAMLRERIAGNSLLPRLDLTAGLDLAGEDDGAGAAFGEVGTADFASYLVGLAIEVPLGNRAARAELKQAGLRVRSAVLNYERAMEETILDVKTALRDVRSGAALMEATRSLRLAQTENLRTLLLEEERRRQLTPEFLNLKFQRQEGLALAQIEEVAAKANYRRALAALDRAVGTGIGADRVILEEQEEGVGP